MNPASLSVLICSQPPSQRGDMIVVAEVCRRKGRRARIVPNETLRGIMICGFAWSRRAIKLIPWCWDQDVHPVRQPGIHCMSKAWQSFLCALARGSIPPNTSCQGRGQTHYEEQWSFPHEKKRFSCSDSCCYLFKSIQQTNFADGRQSTNKSHEQ